jgi:hypothetical protein
MKRHFFITIILLTLAVNPFFAGDLIGATYDLTGTWNYTLSGNWANGDPGCNPGPAATGVCEITQTGDTFTFRYTSGVECDPVDSCTFEGTVDDENYTGSTTDIVDSEGGTTTSTIIFTASSDSEAGGFGESIYTHPSGEWECRWGSQITLTRSGEPPRLGQYTLTVSVTGSGTVTLDPPGGTYSGGTQVQLTAVPDSSETFSGWSEDLSGTDNPATLIMNVDKNITAVFTSDSGRKSEGEGESKNEAGCFIFTVTYD